MFPRRAPLAAILFVACSAFCQVACQKIILSTETCTKNNAACISDIIFKNRFYPNDEALKTKKPFTKNL